MFSTVFVTVENFGTSDVEGLRVVFDVQYKKLSTGEVFNWSENLGTVNVGETLTVKTWLQYGYSKRTFVAFLMLDDIIVDKATTSITFS